VTPMVVHPTMIAITPRTYRPHSLRIPRLYTALAKQVKRSNRPSRWRALTDNPPEAIREYSEVVSRQVIRRPWGCRVHPRARLAEKADR
jgi:hypothetical protein